MDAPKTSIIIESKKERWFIKMNLFGRKSKLDRVIDAIETDMLDGGTNSLEYPRMVTHLTELLKAKAESKRGISPDVVVQGIFGVVGLILVLEYEKVGIIASKAFGMLPRGRV